MPNVVILNFQGRMKHREKTAVIMCGFLIGSCHRRIVCVTCLTPGPRRNKGYQRRGPKQSITSQAILLNKQRIYGIILILFIGVFHSYWRVIGCNIVFMYIIQYYCHVFYSSGCGIRFCLLYNISNNRFGLE